jgi:hypothetical protein
MDNSIVLYVFVVVVNTGKSHVSDGELDRAIEQGRAAAMEIFNEVSVSVVRAVVGHINGRWEGRVQQWYVVDAILQVSCHLYLQLGVSADTCPFSADMLFCD